MAETELPLDDESQEKTPLHPTGDQQHESAEAGDVTDDVGGEEQDIIALASHDAHNLLAGQSGIRQSGEAASGKSFDDVRYNRIRGCHRIKLSDTPEHLALVGALYRELELPEEAFYSLHEQETEEFESHLQQGCYVDRFQPTEKEHAALAAINPNYVSSGDEFAALLKGEHPRCACSDFHAWMLVDAEGKPVALTAVFLPPKEEHRLQSHAEYVRDFFSEERNNGKKFRKKMGANTQLICDRASTTAELFMIGVARDAQGAGIPALADMLDTPEISEAEITDWFLLRLGALEQVAPTPDTHRVGRDDDNEASRRIFKKLAFHTVGEFDDEEQLAAREIQGNAVVIVHPIWNVMHAQASTMKSAVNDKMHQLAEKMRKK